MHTLKFSHPQMKATAADFSRKHALSWSEHFPISWINKLKGVFTANTRTFFEYVLANWINLLSIYWFVLYNRFWDFFLGHPFTLAFNRRFNSIKYKKKNILMLYLINLNLKLIAKQGRNDNSKRKVRKPFS